MASAAPTLPPFIVEWAIWVNLDKQRSAELILLKGHLFLEVVLAQALKQMMNVTESQAGCMSFYRKLSVLGAGANINGPLDRALSHARALNVLRNKLAHDPFFDTLRGELSVWSERVLIDFPSERFQRYTARTKSTQAIASLAKFIYSSLSPA